MLAITDHPTKTIHIYLKSSSNSTSKVRIFMQDGARCHTSRQMQNWFAQQDVTLLDWPGQSPDMNPIENLWTAFKRLPYQKFKPPRNLAQLEFNIRKNPSKPQK